MNLQDSTKHWELTHEGKVQLNYIYDLFEQGYDLEQIADIVGTKVWCIQLLFTLDEQSSKD
jgi:hypothetical protein